MRGWRPGSLLFFFPQEWSGQEFTWSCAPCQGIFTFAKWYCLVYWCQKSQLNKISLLKSNPPPSSFQLDLLFFQSRLWLGFFWCIYVSVCSRGSSHVLPLLCLVKYRVLSQVSLPMPVLKDSNTGGTLCKSSQLDEAIECQRRASRRSSCP